MNEPPVIDREQQWTDMHEQYLRDRGSHVVYMKDRFPAICLVMRDAPWAAGLFPTSSLGRLGVTASPLYEEWRLGRQVWFWPDKQGRPVAELNDDARHTRTTQVLANAGSEEELQKLAAWLRSEQ